MGSSLVIPLEERFPTLRDFLLEQTDSVAQIKKHHPKLIPEEFGAFLYLCAPWIIAPADEGQEILLKARRQQFEAAGFQGLGVKTQLGKILSEDKHLRECCANVGQLAQFLDARFVTPSMNLVAAGAANEVLRDHFEEFSKLTYEQGRFKTIGLYHIFNFTAYDTSLQVGDMRIERLDSPTVSRMLGEPSIPSFLHPQGVGDYFVIIEREGPCDDFIAWLIESQGQVERLVDVLKYFKDGIVYIDYAVPHFLPEWVNQTRKWGVFFLGSPRRLPYEMGSRPYNIGASEMGELAQWWTAYQLPAITARLSDTRNTMRQADLRAAHYYESSHTQANAVDRLVGLAIALEAMFSPSDHQELSYRISQYASQLVGETPDERAELFKELKAMYNRRSALMHGTYDVEKYFAKTFVTHGECDKWASIIRRCILRVLTLYLRGKSDRNEFLAELSRAALDHSLAEKLRIEANPQRYLNEIVPGHATGATSM